MLKGPTGQHDLLDRSLECESDIETPMVELMNQAISAGWTAEDFCFAIIGLGDRLLLGQAATAKPCLNKANAVVSLNKPRLRVLN
jgi:hypothetical protein